MNEPLFLSVPQVHFIHRRALELHGGIDGVRDQSLLESAVAQAQHVYWYGYGDLYDIAAAYCFHIAQSQSFLDGNKRTAVAAGLTFLKINGINTNIELTIPLYTALNAVAERSMSRDELTRLLRNLLS